MNNTLYDDFFVKKERGETVLFGCKKDVLGTLVIPEGITKIAPCSFVSGINNIKPDVNKIIFPKTLKKIPKLNFEMWETLKEVEIPEGVSFIDDYAFQSTGIEKIILPSTIEKIGKGVFCGCEKLHQVTINHISASILNGLINDEHSIYGPFSMGYNENKLRFSLYFGSSSKVEITDLYKYYDRNDKNKFSTSGSGFILYGNYIIAYIGAEKKLTIPEHAVGIAPEAFINNLNIQRLDLNKKMKTIGSSAFEGCKNLHTVNINSSIETIGHYAFANTGIKNITLPPNIKNMGESVFVDCDKLEIITITKEIKYKFSTAVWHQNWKDGFYGQIKYDFI